MALVRDKVLSPGFYWYDVNADKSPAFLAWTQQNSSLVKVRKSATFADDSMFSLFSGPKVHTWVLFEVLFPVLWLDQTQFGFPNTAKSTDGPEVVSSGAEPQKDSIDVIADSVKGVVPFLAPVSSGLLVFGGLAGLAYFFRKEIFDVGTKLRKRRAARSR